MSRSSADSSSGATSSAETSSGRRTVGSFLGSVPYGEAVRLQEEVREALRSGSGPERLLLLSHPHVYTLGRNASGSDVVAAPEWLAREGVEVHATDRGGQVTYHGPGQLVGYPVIDLRPDRRDIRRYMRDLQEVLVRTLADFGVDAEPGEGPDHIGVWTGGAKIASLGVHLQRWITTHGFALNVTTDLSYFRGIVACGLPDVRMTSIERVTGRSRELEEVAKRLVDHFGAVFEREMVTEEAGRLRKPTVRAEQSAVEMQAAADGGTRGRR
jgi:lipoyl(octanoyl) transferase